VSAEEFASLLIMRDTTAVAAEKAVVRLEIHTGAVCHRAISAWRVPELAKGQNRSIVGTMNPSINAGKMNLAAGTSLPG
jgi:hypothetical protein